MKSLGVDRFALLLLAAVLLLGCGGEEEKSSGRSSSGAEDAESARSLPEFDVRAGEQGNLEGVLITVQEVLVGKEAEDIMNPEEGKQIAAVYLLLENRSDSELSYSAGTDFVLLDDTGGSYSTNMFSGKKDPLRAGFLSSYEKAEGWLVFNPSADAQAFVLSYRGLPDKELRILLRE